MKNTLPFNEIREIDIYTSSPQNQNTKSQGKEIQFKNFRNTHEILLRGKTKGTIIIEGFVPNLKLHHEIKEKKKLGFWIFIDDLCGSRVMEKIDHRNSVESKSWGDLAVMDREEGRGSKRKEKEI
ncbi:hypothetical protein GmHk_18G053069 [Glycine max]|nr:hypothetical protein GmHk_18G053069 [Glycine max]